MRIRPAHLRIPSCPAPARPRCCRGSFTAPPGAQDGEHMRWTETKRRRSILAAVPALLALLAAACARPPARRDDHHPRARGHHPRLRPLARRAGRRLRPPGTALGGARRRRRGAAADRRRPRHRGGPRSVLVAGRAAHRLPGRAPRTHRPLAARAGRRRAPPAHPARESRRVRRPGGLVARWPGHRLRAAGAAGQRLEGVAKPARLDRPRGRRRARVPGGGHRASGSPRSGMVAGRAPPRGGGRLDARRGGWPPLADRARHRARHGAHRPRLSRRSHRRSRPMAGASPSSRRIPRTAPSSGSWRWTRPGRRRCGSPARPT